MIREEKHTVHCQCCHFWGDAQVLGHGRLKKKVQGEYTLNEKQNLPCWRWCRGPLLFLRQFLRFVLLLLFHNSGKLTIPHDHLFVRLQILHLVLLKSLQSQGKLNISGRSDLPFVRNDFFAIYFQPSLSKSCRPPAATMQRGLRHYR